MRHLRILIAASYPLIRFALRCELEEAELEVCAEAGTAQAAVEAAVRTRPDVCLLDMSLPGGGLAAATEIRRSFPGVPIVMLTASGEDEDVHAALDAGVAAFVGKEADPRRLPLVVRAVAGGAESVGDGSEQLFLRIGA